MSKMGAGAGSVVVALWEEVVHDAILDRASIAVLGEDRFRHGLLGRVASLAGDDRTVAVLGVRTLVHFGGPVWVGASAGGEVSHDIAVAVHLFGEDAVVILDQESSGDVSEMLRVATSLRATLVVGCRPEQLTELAATDHGWWTTRLGSVAATFPWCDIALVAETADFDAHEVRVAAGMRLW
jgi:hypothetical protein